MGLRWWMVMGCVGLTLSCASAGRAGDANTDPASLTQVQATYLERCGGCHGIQGSSSPKLVPNLRGQVGHFLCLPEGRAYLVRLPSIASSPLTDREVAELMNFVVFDLGRMQAIAEKYPAYTAEEVGRLRAQPLNAVALVSYRAEIVEQLISRCDAPVSLRDYLHQARSTGQQ